VLLLLQELLNLPEQFSSGYFTHGHFHWLPAIGD
jgi:hypothetical protein